MQLSELNRVALENAIRLRDSLPINSREERVARKKVTKILSRIDRQDHRRAVYRQRHPKKCPIQRKERLRKLRATLRRGRRRKLTDGFVRQHIKKLFRRQGIELEPTMEMVRVKRALLKIKRLIKERRGQ